MKILGIVLLALVVAVVAGHYVAEDPGFIVIGYGGKVVRTTFAFFLLVLAISVVLLISLLNIARNVSQLRQRWRRWNEERRRQRASDGLSNGLVAMAAGDFARAERLFTRSIDPDNQPEVHYLSAAYAAEALNLPQRRDNYMALARDSKPEIQSALDTKHAEWLLDHRQLSDASALVEQFRGSKVANAQVLKLRMALCRLRDDDETILALLPDLRHGRAISHDDANVLERSCVVNLLEREREDLAALRSRWRVLARNLRTAPSVIAAYVRGLSRHGAEDEAETLLRKQIERVWDSELVALYGEILCEPPSRQLRRLDVWSRGHLDDPGLRLARARQSIRAGLWGQAREQLEALIKTDPSPLLHQLLAEIADSKEDAVAALEHRRIGLELATGEAGMAMLPAPPVDHEVPAVSS
jgi:HemY protein